MANHIKRIKTNQGNVQIDYSALANLPSPDTTLSTIGGFAEASVVGHEIDYLQTNKASAVTKTTEGKTIFLNDSSDAKLKEMRIMGRTDKTLNGLVSYNAYTYSQGGNLLPYPYRSTSTSQYGVTFTDNGDGTLSLYGTAIQEIQYVLYNGNIVTGANYLSGCELTPGLSLVASDNSTNGKIIHQEGHTFLDGMSVKQVYISISNGTTVNTIIKPMLSYSEIEYERYKNLSVWDWYTEELHGVPVEENGNYIDEDGQMWICDEINCHESKHIQRIGVIKNYSGQEINTSYLSSGDELATGSTIYYVLNEPIETTLSTYSMLPTYYPSSTLYGNSYIIIKYVADTEKYIDNVITKTGVLIEEKDPTVPEWAKATEKPSYTKDEIGLENVDNIRQYSADNPPPYPVTSVNGQTGDVVITASGGEISLENYYSKEETYSKEEVYSKEEIDNKEFLFDIPMATETSLGGIKAASKTDAETIEVKLGSNGKLYVPPTIADSITSIEVDDSLSVSSENPVSNKAITNALNEKMTAPVIGSVGQVIAVKSVDENGKPIEYNAIDVVVSDSGFIDESAINEHNTSSTAHNDIREIISGHSNASNPHNITKSTIGLSNVENKSSETIRSEITKENVTSALGYTPLSSTTSIIDSLSDLGITASASELNKLDGVTVTTNEFNYLSGVKSSIQTQLDGKSSSSHNHTTSDIISGKFSYNSIDIETILALHVWKKFSEKPTYTETSVTNVDVISYVGTTTITYSDDIEISDGIVSLANSKNALSVTFSKDNLKNKYVSAKDNNIYYIPEDATITTSSSAVGNYTSYTWTADKATKYVSSTADVLGFVTSEASDTYPTNGSSGSYWYVYKKQLGDK